MLSLISVHHCAKVDNSYHLVSFMIETDINVPFRCLVGQKSDFKNKNLCKITFKVLVLYVFIFILLFTQQSTFEECKTYQVHMNKAIKYAKQIIIPNY